MFNKKNKFQRFFVVFFIALSLSLSFLLTSSVFAGDVFGTEFVEGTVNLGSSDPRGMAAQIINVALGLLAIIAVVIVIYGGFVWMTSDGNEEKVNRAKGILKAGVIGLAIILASWGIASFVLSQLGQATGTSGVVCEDSTTKACGCGGIATCINGSWGDCVGSSCPPGGHGADCSSGLSQVCTPDNDICASGLVCGDDCKCEYPGEGDACGDNLSGACTPLDSDCNPNLFCDANSCTCEVSGNNNYSELGDPCFDGGSCSADNPACNLNHGLTCSPGSCTCVGNPVITGFSPLGGFCNNNVNNPCAKDSDCGSGNTCNFTTPNTSAGNFFTILGYNFDNYINGSSTVSFINSTTNSSTIALDPSVVNSDCSNSWINTSITVALPTTTPFSPGDNLKVEVVTKDGKSYNSGSNSQLSLVKWNNISRPGICSVNSDSAKLNDNVSYQGINLKDSKAYFGNNINNVLAYAPQVFTSNTLGFAHVPNLSAGKTSTFVQKKYNNIPVFSNFLDFTKEAEAPQGPSISNFTPPAGPSGQYVTIIGTGFNSARGNSKVIFKQDNTNKEANYNFPLVCAHSIWSDKQIIVKVPSDISDGDYNLVLKIGNWPEITANGIFTASSSMSLSPGLCKISPKSGPQNAPVSLWGEYFGNNPIVVFNKSKSSSSVSTSTEDLADKISATVPSGAITGPVVVKRDANSTSNSLNFLVASCSSDNDCDSTNNTCCLSGTPLAGACVDNLNNCFSETPDSSFFQWGFTTGFSTTTPPIDPGNVYSCASYNFCPTDNWTCPNMPGLCSPYDATDRFIEVADCKSDCSNFSFCGTNGTNCTYQGNIDKCVLSSPNTECSLGKKVEYNLGYGTTTKTAICKNYKIQSGEKQYLEITVDALCPNIDGVQWSLVTGTNNKCVNVAEFGVADSTCFLCPAGATCQSQNSGAETGLCVSPKVCPGNATCNSNNKCEKPDTSSCQCCCEIDKNSTGGSVPSLGNPACCYPLICAHTCGVSAVIGATNTDFGLCSGCKISDTASTADRDLACNCATVSGQYCEVSDKYENGVCLDCTSLGEVACKAHPSTCCWDNKKSVCRGGASGSDVWSSNLGNTGYCPYYNCDGTDPTQCNSNSPNIDGQYPNIGTCTTSCRDNCAGITNEGVCKGKDGCCWNSATSQCSGGDKYSENHLDPNYGLCSYFTCVTAGQDCTKGTSTTPYLKQDVCDKNCVNTPSGFGGACYVYPQAACYPSLCNILSCLKADGGAGEYSANNPAASCGTCCCNPLSPSDQCSTINSNLTCVADKGMCTGASRGLCCGCSSDQECSPAGVAPTQVGCGFDSCCKARPEIATDNSKVAQLSVSPAHTSNNVCRNALIEINFDQRMDPLTLEGNILLLEEKDSGSSCSAGTSQISLADEIYQPNKNIFAKIKNIFQKSINYIAKITGKTAIASPSASKIYCAVFGLVDFKHDTSNNNKTTVYFKPNKLLEAKTKYFVVVKGDKNLDSSSGVKAFSGVGMNGTGYYISNSWTESNASTTIKFGSSGVYYENSYIWDFITLSVNTAGQGICEVDYVKVSPESYLFQTTVNDINENDTDPTHSTFNSVRDRDTQYTASAYSKDSQIITPTDGYEWTWDWEIVDNDKFNFDTNPLSWVASGDRRLVRVKDGVTKGDSEIKAKVIMATSNITSAGNDTIGTAKAYVLICRNPWPAVNADGLWEPWKDINASGTSLFNYELYYCRDHGSNNIEDDLPELNQNAIFKGGSSIKVCSNNPFKSCSADIECSGGLCLSSFLKETYFFRQ